MSTKIQLAIAALLALGLLAFSATSAGAASDGGYGQVNFKAEIKGVQTYVDEYHHASTDRCDTAIDSVEHEKVKFASKKPILLTATRIPEVKGLVLTSGTKPLRFPTKAKISRSHSHSASQVPSDCGDNGGGAEVTPPDCGTRTVSSWKLGVDYYKRSRLELTPDDYDVGTDLYKNCGSGKFPLLLPAEVFGKNTSAELPESEVFDEKIGKIITIGDGEQFLAQPEGFSETKLRWELSITRIKDKK